MKFSTLLTLAGMLMFASCRTAYQPVNIFGTDINGSQPQPSELRTATETAPAVTASETTLDAIAMAAPIEAMSLIPVPPAIASPETDGDSCVQLVWKKGDSVRVNYVRIVNNNAQTLTYTRCDENNAVVYTLPKTEVLNIVSNDNVSTVVPDNYTLKTNRSSVTSFVFGLLALFPYYSSLLFGILGIICAVRAQRQIKKDPAQKGDKLATSGLVLSIVGMAIFTSLFLLVAIAFGI